MVQLNKKARKRRNKDAVTIKARQLADDAIKITITAPPGDSASVKLYYDLNVSPDSLPIPVLEVDHIYGMADLNAIEGPIKLEYKPVMAGMVYHIDDRAEISQVTDFRTKENAKAVAGIIKLADLDFQDNHVGYQSESLYDWQASKHRFLANNVRFRDQPVAAKQGTAFLVETDIIATARHCVENIDLNDYAFAFHYEIPQGRTYPGVSIPATIARPDHIISQGSGLDDWALVRLKEPVIGVSPLNLSSRRSISLNRPLYVIGHPLGLPKKYADNGHVTVNSAQTHFTTNLDTFGGNSGSPVFDAINHSVVGMLVRGQPDFKLGDDGLYVLNSIDDDITSSGGEDCTRISSITDALENITWFAV